MGSGPSCWPGGHGTLPVSRGVVTDFSSTLDSLATALESAQYGTFNVPFELQSSMTTWASGVRAFAGFVDHVEQTGSAISNFTALLEAEILERKARDSQMGLAFEGEREKIKHELMGQSEQLARMEVLLERALQPQPTMVAAIDALALLRQTPSDGAPREVVVALQQLDEALTDPQIEASARKVDLLLRVVGEAEDLIEVTAASDDHAGLREALADLRQG